MNLTNNNNALANDQAVKTAHDSLARLIHVMEFYLKLRMTGDHGVLRETVIRCAYKDVQALEQEILTLLENETPTTDEQA